jgi:hypothetical protein
MTFQVMIGEINPFFYLEDLNADGFLSPGDVVAPKSDKEKKVVLMAQDLEDAEALSQTLSRVSGCDVFILDRTRDREIYFGFDPNKKSVCGNGGMTVHKKSVSSIDVYPLHASAQHFGNVHQMASRASKANPDGSFDYHLAHFECSYERLVESEQWLDQALHLPDETIEENRKHPVAIYPNWQKRAALIHYVQKIRETESAENDL